MRLSQLHASRHIIAAACCTTLIGAGSVPTLAFTPSAPDAGARPLTATSNAPQANVALNQDPNPPLVSIFDSIADNRQLEIVIFANYRHAGSGIQRNISGDWAITQQNICVDAFMLFDDRPMIPLRALRSDYNGPQDFVSPRAAYGALSTSPTRLLPSTSSNQTEPTPELRLYVQAVASAVQNALRNRLGASVDVRVASTCRDNVASAYLFPRVFLREDIRGYFTNNINRNTNRSNSNTLSNFNSRFPDAASRLRRIEAGDLTEIADFGISELRSSHANVVARATNIQGNQRQFLQDWADSEPAGPGARYGAVVVGGSQALTQDGVRPCAINPTNSAFPNDAADLGLILSADRIRSAIPGQRRAVRSFANPDDLFLHLKSRDRWCNVVVGHGRTLSALVGALNRDGVEHRVIWHSIAQAELGNIKAQTLGFRSIEGRSALQAWAFSQEIGNAPPREIETLRELGVQSKPSFDDATRRMAANGIGGPLDVAAVIDFLRDERVATQAGQSVRQLRAERVEAARREAAKEEALRADQRAEQLGFRSSEGRTASQAFAFAREIGDATPAQVDALRRFGILDRPTYEEARARYIAAGLGREPGTDTLLAFLNDEGEARARGISIGRFRAEREASAQRAAAQAEAANREAERRRAIEFPYIALISCTVGNTNTTVRGCMTGDGGRTELELRNGTDYRMYQIQDVEEAGRRGPLGLEIDLRSNFSLAIRNASTSLLLTVTVIRRNDRREIFRQSAAYRGLISVRN